MAQRVHVVLEDDILGNGQPADETVTFALDGVNYEIDLNNANAARLREALATYVAKGRRVSGRKSSGTRSSSSSSSRSSGRDLNAVRTWARANGHQVADRGRVSAEILEAYDAAQAGGSAATRTPSAAPSTSPVTSTTASPNFGSSASPFSAPRY